MLDQSKLITSPLFAAIFQAGGSPSFSPADIAGLQLWLRADTGTFQDSAKTNPATDDGDVVGGWEDQSANGNDASQPTTALKPLLKLNIANSKPIIRFDGTDDWVSGFSASFTNFTLFFVFSPVVLVQNEGMFSYVPASGFDWNQENAFAITQQTTAGNTSQWIRNIGANPLGITDAAITENAFQVVTLIFNSGTAERRVNGGNLATDTYSNVNAIDAIEYFLSTRVRGPTDAGQNDFAEVIFYDSPLSSGDRGLVETYLNGRYALF